jgi:signal transduction histidine kinase
MNYLQRFIQEVRVLLFFSFLVNNILLVMLAYYVSSVWSPPIPVLLGTIVIGCVFTNFLMERLVTGIIMQPLKLLWQNILHTAPTTNIDPPEQRKAAIKVGLDLVDQLSRHVHQLAMTAYSAEATTARALPDHHRNFIANSLPLPLIVLDNQGRVLFANIAAERYFSITEPELVGQSLGHKISLRFGQADENLADWIARVQADSVTAGRSWDDVRYTHGDDDTLHFDLAAFYNKDNPEGIETMLVFFDHTATYSQFDADIGFVALAIHELRTPVTMLRGYIEALDEELRGKLQGETKDFFDKMKVSSHQLTSFIDNILNVARIEGNQFEVELHEEDWDSIVRAAVSDLRLRAEVRGMELR